MQKSSDGTGNGAEAGLLGDATARRAASTPGTRDTGVLPTYFDVNEEAFVTLQPYVTVIFV